MDIQPKMLDALKRRLAKAHLLERVDVRLAKPHSMGVAELAGAVDFLLAFALVHELPSPGTFFQEAAQCLRAGAILLLAEPAGHVKAPQFETELELAERAGLRVTGRPVVKWSRAALLEKS